MSDTSLHSCPKCGATLPPSAPEGLCPRCLMALNLEEPTLLTGEDANVTQPAAPPVSAPTPEELAPHFPQLDILECLGRGGMGVVYKARQKSLKRFVALKLLAPERVHDAAFAARFAREAEALAALNHPHIVTVHDFGQAGTFFYLLMEYVDGVNLRQAMRGGRLTPEQALAVVPPICEALQYAHEHGIVHRDIKPENLLMDKQGRVKIADFGIARMLDAPEEDAVPGDSQPAGTPQYMAPEQREHPQRADARADIYSLGVVLYEMLTGELPAKQFEPPSRKVRVDVRLDEIVLRALDRSPELRWQTAADLRTQIVTLGNANVEAASSPAAAPAGAVPGPAAAASSSAPPFPSSAPVMPRSSVAEMPRTYPRVAAVLVLVSLLIPLLLMVSVVGVGSVSVRSPEARFHVSGSTTSSSGGVFVSPPQGSIGEPSASGDGMPRAPQVTTPFAVSGPAWSAVLLPLLVFCFLLELGSMVTGTLLGWSHLSAQRKKGQPFEHLTSGLFASLVWPCLLGGGVASLLALYICAILGLMRPAGPMAFVAFGVGVWWIMRTTLRWLHSGAPSGPGPSGKSNGKGVPMAVIGCVGLAVLGSVAVFVLLAGYWFLAARRASQFPPIPSPAQVSAPTPSEGLPGEQRASSPDVEVLLQAGKYTRAEQITKAMQAMQAARVVHLSVKQTDEAGFMARIVAPRGCPRQRAEEVASRLRDAGVPHIETEVVEPLTVIASEHGQSPSGTRIINTEGAHVLTPQLTLVIRPPATGALGQPSQRGYSIIWQNRAGVLTERGYAPLAREGEDYVAFWNQETNCLWLGSPSFLGWHHLVKAEEDNHETFLKSNFIPQSIAGIMPDPFREAVSKWYQNPPQ